ncbi:MAG: Fur family transcriptional regulator [Hyphomicrobiales bacterium]
MAKATKNLTKNQAMVLDTLCAEHAPLSAYSILDELRDQGLKAPLQVYRALEKLVEFGMVHKLESLNAFIACSHPKCKSHDTVAFAICDTCNSVSEVANTELSKRLYSIAKEDGFALKQAVVELRGSCQECLEQASNS